MKLSPSRLAWGMWRFRGADTDAADTLVRTALDAGISLLDHRRRLRARQRRTLRCRRGFAGHVLARDPALRGRMALASKGGIVPGVPYDSSASYLIEACEASLRRLNTDHLDLYQIHRPDILAHPAEVAGAFARLRDAGKILQAGVSNFSAAQIRALAAHMSFPLASMQPEFSPLSIGPLSDGLLDLAQELSLAVLAWSPLGGGRLGGTGADKRSRDVIAALDVVAARENVSRTAVVYAWIMAHPARPVPIVGSQTPRAHPGGDTGIEHQNQPHGMVRDLDRVAAGETAMSGTSCEVAWFSALCDDDYEFLGEPDPRLLSSFEHCRNIVLTAEQAASTMCCCRQATALGIDTLAFRRRHGAADPPHQAARGHPLRRNVAPAAGAANRDPGPDARRPPRHQHHFQRHARRSDGQRAALPPHARVHGPSCATCWTARASISPANSIA